MLGRQVAAVLHSSANARFIKPLTTTFTTRLSIRVAPVAHRRFYATPGRPKKAVGEAGRPIKRTTKKATTTKTTKAAAKKPKAKKKVAKKPVKKAKKVLTEEQLAVKQKRADAVKLRELKAAALKPPTVATTSAYLQFTAGRKSAFPAIEAGTTTTINDVRARIAEFARENARLYKQLSPSEVEHLNHLAHQAKQKSQAEYKQWVQSHTVEQINLANLARTRLRRLARADTTSKRKTTWAAIEDERIPKKAANTYAMFVANRSASGDFKNIHGNDVLKLLGQEWKALSETEKQKYKDIQQNHQGERYSSEYGQQAAAGAA